MAGRLAGDCVNRWSGFRHPVVTAIIAATAAVALTGCGAAGASGDDGEHAAAEESSLPPGVMPPNDPPQPGDARLGPDGHYDYSAPDFVLKNPCDTEYFQRAMELGWQVPEIGTKRRDEPDSATCSIVNDSTGLPLVNFKNSATELEKQGYSAETHTIGGISFVMLRGNALFGESCFAGVETELGFIGAMSGTGGFSQFTNLDDACNEAQVTIIPILGEN